jgi:hypothetical protein
MIPRPKRHPKSPHNIDLTGGAILFFCHRFNGGSRLDTCDNVSNEEALHEMRKA